MGTPPITHTPGSVAEQEARAAAAWRSHQVAEVDASRELCELNNDLNPWLAPRPCDTIYPAGATPNEVAFHLERPEVRDALIAAEQARASGRRPEQPALVPPLPLPAPAPIPSPAPAFSPPRLPPAPGIGLPPTRIATPAAAQQNIRIKGPTPVPIPGDPVTVIVTSVIAGIAALFRIFGGGVSRAVKRALEGLRDVMAANDDTLMRFSWKGFFGFGGLLRAVLNLWVRVLRPIVEHVANIAARLGRLIDRVLKPYLDTIRKIRAAVLRIYERYVRPVLYAIQTLRQVLLILRLLRVRFAEKLDAELVKLQNRLMLPLQVVLEKLNELTGWVNILLTARIILQEPIWINSLAEYAGDSARFLLARATSGLSASEQAKQFPSGAAVSAQQASAQTRAHLLAGGVPDGGRAVRAFEETARLAA